MSPTAKYKLKRWLLNWAHPLKNNQNVNPGKAALDQGIPKGINLIGYARAEMGIGESLRMAARSIESVGLPFGVINFTGTNPARMQDTSWQHRETKDALYNVNVFHINAEQMMELYGLWGASIFENKYNIGYWHWELPDFPDEWLENVRFVQEIWVPSRFVAESIAIKSLVPVVRIPHGIEVRFQKGARKRSDFGLPEGVFLFLMMYDVHSYQERKNPQGVIEAFKAAFTPGQLDVGLVIKVNHAGSNPGQVAQLDQLALEYPNVYLLKETFSREDTNQLIHLTDSYVSLHRAEGFGLGLAEAMYLGKPVIGTNWSANIDFMNKDNSCLVDYRLISVGKDYGPYKAYQHWADPDVEHAAAYMRKLLQNPEFARRIAVEGQRTIQEEFSPQSVGSLIQKRLTYLGLS